MLSRGLDGATLNVNYDDPLFVGVVIVEDLPTSAGDVSAAIGNMPEDVAPDLGVVGDDD